MKKRSVLIAGHSTSITLEEAFWTELKTIACRNKISINKIVTDIDKNRAEDNLSSAIRLFILNDLKSRLTQDAS